MASTSKLLPGAPPQQIFTESAKVLMEHACYHAVSLVGVRGYFKQAFGDPNKNDIGVYDDAIFLCYPDGFQGFNANVDPSKLVPGMATLKPGVWFFKLGIHGLSKPANLRYEALVQAAKVVVWREGQPEDEGFFGVNIHRGGNATTGSAGCQTIPPGQWGDFIAAVRTQLDKYGQKVIPYLLVDNG